jgi:agmatine/peptidylarginine deiminase
MKNDEIIEMARQAWADTGEGWVAKDWFDDRAKAFEAFAKLVAAKEREKILQMCNSASEATKEAKKQLRADEIFAHSVASGAIHQSERLINAIRARGQA